MSIITTPPAPLHYDRSGAGEPLVLVHGSWTDRTVWDLVAPGLAASFDVVAYDRRGHGDSPGTARSRREHEDDLARLIESLDRGPVHLVGTSYGAAIALGLAARRPELVRSLTAHEPPLIALVADRPELQPQLAALLSSAERVRAEIEGGDDAGAARRFVEEVALGPGAWEVLPDAMRQSMIDHAPTFVVEQRDPAGAALAPAALTGLTCPVTLTQGDQSPAWFAPIVAELAAAIPQAGVHTYQGAGHTPHATHPGEFVAATTEKTR